MDFTISGRVLGVKERWEMRTAGRYPESYGNWSERIEGDLRVWGVYARVCMLACVCVYTDISRDKVIVR